MFHVYLTLDCTQWDKVDYSERYRIACWMLINRIYRLWRTKAEEQPLYVLASLLLSPHTHTHTHTQRERERASGRKPQPQSLFKNTTTSQCLSRSVSKVGMIDVLSAAQMEWQTEDHCHDTTFTRTSFSC